MHRKQLVLFTTMLLLLVTTIQAQRNTSSPYSRFGYGLLNDNALSFGQAMSSTGISLRPSNHLNFLNPASFSAIDSSHFIFEVGVKNQTTTISADGQKAKTSNSNMEYLAIGFPVTRWWGMGLTMLPYSKVGYSFASKDVLVDSTIVDSYYYGIGGNNQVVWANSFSLFKGLSVGVNSGFIFGQTSLNAYNILTTDRLSDNTSKVNTINSHGFYFETGFQYVYTVTDKKSFVFGATFSPLQYLKSTNSQYVTNGSNTSVSSNDSTVKSSIPMKIGGGIGYVVKDKLQIGFDVKQQDWTKASIYGISSAYFSKLQSVHLGCEYLPNKFSSTSYFKRVRYRAGMRYLKSNLSLPENSTSAKLNSVNEMAGSFGLGIPLKMSANNINISVEYGKRSTKSSALPIESFFIINLNFTLNENWFYKRKIK